MHLFLQICGVAGFGFLAAAIAGFELLPFVKIAQKDTVKLGRLTIISFVLISTYFVFR